MRKIYLSIFTSLLLMLGLVNVAQADEYLRIGMEAAYAPLTGLRTMIAMELSKSMGLTSMLTDMMFKSPRKSLRT